MSTTWLKRQGLRHGESLLLPLELARTGPTPAALRALRLLRRPIVIGGCGRSGTTLMESVLSCHPEIYAIGSETAALCPHAYDDLTRAPDTNWAMRLDLLARRVRLASPGPEVRSICEKTPRNVHFFPKVLRRFGERARLIHMVRDGREVVTSRHPLNPESYWVSPERWVVDVEAGNRLEGHPQMLTVRYEDFADDFEGTLRRICRFLEVPFSEAFHGYPETATVEGTTEQRAWFGSRRKVARSAPRWNDPCHRDVVNKLLDDPRAVRLLETYGYLAQ